MTPDLRGDLRQHGPVLRRPGNPRPHHPIRRLVDTATPIGGSRHDSVAFTASGLAQRWAGHLADGGPGMLGDKGVASSGRSGPGRRGVIHKVRPCGTNGRDEGGGGGAHRVPQGRVRT